jgi:RNA polymerase sigma factor (sigma-70 family)
VIDRPLSDAELILASQEEPEVFEVLFDRHFDTVYRFLVARVGPDDAEDLASEVFVRAFAARHRYRREVISARPWLYGIAANLAKQRARSLRYRAQKYQRLRNTREHVVLDTADDITARADAQAQWPAIATALGRLTADEREVIGLHLVAGLTQAETARVLGIPKGTVKSRLSRARHRLGEHLMPPRGTNEWESGGPNEGNADG